MPTGPQRELSPVYNTGYGSAKVSKQGYVWNMGIREPHRGKGHGGELMKRITTDADLSRQTLTLHARPELHRFYGAHGFEHIGEDQFGPVLQRKPKTVGEYSPPVPGSEQRAKAREEFGE
jgi:Acetyltransferase (GNAT) domain